MTNRKRKKDLIEKRDRKLLFRFHQLTEVQRLRFDDAVFKLSDEEFFISEQRIWWIVRKNVHILEKIKNGEISETA